MVQEKLKENEIIVGRKPIQNYCYAVLQAFETNDSVVISARGSNINLMERIISLFKCLGVEEVERKAQGMRGRDGNTTEIRVLLQR